MRLRTLAIAAMVFSAPAVAQEFKRTVLQRTDVPMSAPHETVVGTAEIIPGGTTGRPTHPGVEMMVAVEGDMDAFIEGQEPVHLKVGDSIIIPHGKVHEVRNVGVTPSKVVATWMVEKGKPMATPAP